MSRKAFILWGLGLIHAYLIVWAIGLYLTFSMVFPKDIFFTHLSFLFFCTLFFGFGALLWRRFETIGRRKRALAWCALFYVGAWLFTIIFLWPHIMDLTSYEAVADKFFDHIYTWRVRLPALRCSLTKRCKCLRKGSDRVTIFSYRRLWLS